MMRSIEFLKKHHNAKLPTRGSEYAAGLDLYCVEDFELPIKKYKSVNIGLSVAIPSGFYGRIAPRSSLAIKYGIDVLAGVIDNDYRGEIICILINHGEQSVTFKSGTRIAQLIVESIIYPEPVWSDFLNKTIRGHGGFGSTE